MTNNTELREQIRKEFNFTDDHLFEAQGTAPFNCMKCMKCDKFATHHLNYSALDTMEKLLATQRNNLLAELNEEEEEEAWHKGYRDGHADSGLEDYKDNLLIDIKKLMITTTETEDRKLYGFNYALDQVAALIRKRMV